MKENPTLPPWLEHILGSNWFLIPFVIGVGVLLLCMLGGACDDLGLLHRPGPRSKAEESEKDD